MRTKVMLVGVVLVLAGCGGGATPAAEPTTAAPAATVAGPGAFLKFAHAASFGNKDFASATDAQLLDIANLACDEGLGVGLPFGRVVQGYVESDAAPSAVEAEVFARSAVTNLCPEFADQVPK